MSTIPKDLCCGLDEQQCQQECEHKSDRVSCPFTYFKSIKDKTELLVKKLSEYSTAPDKETPDWMESDIRRGIKHGYQLALDAAYWNMSILSGHENLPQGKLSNSADQPMDEVLKRNGFVPGNVFYPHCKKIAEEWAYLQTKAKDQEIEMLKDALKARIITNDFFQERIKELEDKLIWTSENLNKSVTRISELEKENKTLQDAFDNNYKEFMELAAHAKDLEKERDELMKGTEFLGTEIKNLKKENERLNNIATGF